MQKPRVRAGQLQALVGSRNGGNKKTHVLWLIGFRV